jgi:cytochrome bd-type quinol oxidase subunit 2
MHTGENEQGLRKITDMTRLMSMVVLALHFYYYCFQAFKEWKLTAEISDRLLINIKNTGLFSDFNNSKLIALGLLVISLFSARGKKDEKLNYKIAFAYVTTGLIVYFSSYFSLHFPAALQTRAVT